MNIKKLLDKITENWVAKAISIGLAIILYVFHRMTSLETRFFSVPLTVQTSSAFVPGSSYTRIIRISLRGDAGSIASIQEDDIEAYIDLEEYDSEGMYSAPVQIRKRGSALGIEPLEIIVDPAQIFIQLDQKVSRYIPLQANLRGNVAEGFEFVSHTLAPAQVMADGPLSAMNAVTVLGTDLIDLDGRREDFAVTVSIHNQNPLLVIRGSRMTEFRGYIRSAHSVRTIEEIPIVSKNLDEQFEIVIDRLGSVRLEGGRQELDQFVPEPDFFYVDCSEIGEPGNYTLPLIAELPEGLVLLRQDPVELTLEVTVKENQ